jgi:DNA-binding transcriptional MerR regulator
MPKTKGKAAYMISTVAEQYEIHPQTLRLYEREGLLARPRSEGNTRLSAPAIQALQPPTVRTRDYLR